MTLLIKNVKLLGAAEKFPESVDVFINGEKISAIGAFPNKKADKVIDGLGAYLSPGFIDVNTDSDHYLSIFDNPGQEDFLRQGVTTIVGGMCGASLAPLLYGSLESVEEWADAKNFNVDWHTLGEFLSLLDKKPLGVNFATLIGHSTVRRAITGDSLRDLTKNELKVFAGVIKRALAEGGFGLSTGLGYAHGQKTPYSEIKFLAKIVKNFNGVYATHLRKTGSGILESVEETIKLAKETGAKTLISHFLPIQGSEKFYREALAKINSLPKNLDLHFDIYPFDISILPLYTFLPHWAQTGGIQTMAKNISDDWLKPRILDGLADLKPEDVVLSQAPGNDLLVGRSLKDLEEIYNVPDYKSALLKLMETTKLNASVFYRNINKNLIKAAISSPRSLIASNSASFSESKTAKILKPERAVSTFPKFVTMVESEKISTLEEAIKKITLEPAKKFNLARRGLIKEGYFADLTLFKDGEIKSVVVNGVVAFEDGGPTSKLAGHALRHNAG